MSAKKKRNRKVVEPLALGEVRQPEGAETEATSDPGRSRFSAFTAYIGAHRVVLAAIAISLLVGFGVFAKNGWLPSTDPLAAGKWWMVCSGRSRIGSNDRTVRNGGRYSGAR